MATAAIGPEVEIRIRGRVAELDLAFEVGSIPPEVLFVGAAGTGKTWGILWELHDYSRHHPDLRILVCRKTREALTESVLVTYEQEVLPLTGDQWMALGCKRRVRQSYLYPNGTEWIVGGLDKPSKILSTSYDIVFVNEAIELAEEDWETIQSRIGRPERSHPLNCLIGDTNPGAPSHWLKKRCESGRTQEWASWHRDNPALFDGGRWTVAGEAYLARLGRLTGTRRKRLLEGVWAAGEALWFDRFTGENVSEAAEYDWTLPVHVSVDSGVFTGAVFFQRRPDPFGGHVITVFGDWLGEGEAANHAAGLILAALGDRRGTRLRCSTDHAGVARNAIGPTVFAEYERAGLRGRDGLETWPYSSVADSLALLEGFVETSDGRRNLLIHPRCKHLISALHNYKRASRAGQLMDYPEDPQHPAEDMIDALRGGLKLEFPEGLKPTPKFRMTTAHRAMY